MSRGPDAGMLLARAIERDALAAGCEIRITRHERASWASATFDGERHDMTVEAVAGRAFDLWRERLAEAELTMPGRFVADIGIVAFEQSATSASMTIEALTIEA